MVIGCVETAFGAGLIIGPMLGSVFYILAGFMWTCVILGFILVVSFIPTFFILGPDREYKIS